MVWWSLVAAEAKPPEFLHPGELYGYMWDGWTGTAYTTPKNTFMLHPIHRSSFGVAEFMDVKASLPGELLGPQLGIEVAPVQNDKFAVSLDVRGKTGWGFDSFKYSAVPHFSAYLSEKVLLDLSLGIHGRAGSSVDSGDTTGTAGQFVPEPGLRAVRPEISMDFHLSDPLWLVLTARGNALRWEENGAQGALGGYFAYGKGALGFSVGGVLAILGLEGFGEDYSKFEQDVGIDLPNPPAAFPIPLPHAQLWFRL
jgi:hypothetical protein